MSEPSPTLKQLSDQEQFEARIETLELAICLFAKHLFTPQKPLITKRETD